MEEFFKLFVTNASLRTEHLLEDDEGLVLIHCFRHNNRPSVISACMWDSTAITFRGMQPCTPPTDQCLPPHTLICQTHWRHTTNFSHERGGTELHMTINMQPHITWSHKTVWGRESSVAIEKGYRLDSSGSIPGRVKYFSFLQHVCIYVCMYVICVYVCTCNFQYFK
jgi:hypothetical protein